MPVFLVWLYLSWGVILVGALVTAELPGVLESRLPGGRKVAAELEQFDAAGLQQQRARHAFGELDASGMFADQGERAGFMNAGHDKAALRRVAVPSGR